MLVEMEQRVIELELRVKYLETQLLCYRNVTELLKNELKKEKLDKLDLAYTAKADEELVLLYSKASSSLPSNP
jgi:hypothetical protein